MAIQRLLLTQPTKLRGMESYVPKELQEFALEMIRRIEVDRETLVRSLRSQVVVDTSVLPDETLGAQAAASQVTATDLNLVELCKQQTLWEG